MISALHLLGCGKSLGQCSRKSGCFDNRAPVERARECSMNFGPLALRTNALTVIQLSTPGVLESRNPPCRALETVPPPPISGAWSIHASPTPCERLEGFRRAIDDCT
jgi:hypothetical protein